MSPPLARSVMVQEQLGLALNRAGKGDEAERVLQAVLEAQGPSSETYGILGRVYKDRWEAALKAGDTFLADGLLDNAIDAYLKGFQADWRDAYPGINAVTLMELKDPPDPRRESLIPVVTYAVERRIAAGKPDYWDFATQVELAVLGKDKAAASAALRRALAAEADLGLKPLALLSLRLGYILEPAENSAHSDAFFAQAPLLGVECGNLATGEANPLLLGLHALGMI